MADGGRKSGRAVFDNQGRASWEWQTATGVFETDVTNEQLQGLEAAGLAWSRASRRIRARLDQPDASQQRATAPQPHDRCQRTARVLKRAVAACVGLKPDLQPTYAARSFPRRVIRDDHPRVRARLHRVH